MPQNPPPETLTLAEAGDPEAQNALGRWYMQHSDDDRAAERWFQRAADLGLLKARHNLGVLALRRNQQELAVRCFSSAAQSGWLPSMFALGTLAEQAGDIDRALEAYEEAGRQGNADAQDAVGRLFFALDNEKAYAVSRHWSELAAEQGHAASQTRLGTIYHEGLGVPRDSQRAAALFLNAARQGHPGAQLMIGGAYHLGIGIETNRVESAFWLSLCAAQTGEAAAQGARAYLQRVQRELTEEEKAAVDARLREAETPQR